MTARFTVLASGSLGNATLLEVNGFGLLIDCGLHPRTLAGRELTRDDHPPNAVRHEMTRGLTLRRCDRAHRLGTLAEMVVGTWAL